jgi:dolichyl-phosphate beta-glucosyltransferase
MKSPIYLSVVVPVHNEERRLERCLEALVPELTLYKHEIILVDNASLDRTPAMVDLASRVYPSTRAIHLKQKGKGFAVREGMLSASGRYRYMCDVDLSTPAREIHRFIEYARRFDVVIGSREINPETTRTALRRRLMGRVFHWLVSDLVPGVRDTQCGFKMFRDYAARQIFENVTIMGMAFDVEALYLARLFGFTMQEIAVHWTNDDDSRVRLIGDPLEMLIDISQIKPVHSKSRLVDV